MTDTAVEEQVVATQEVTQPEQPEAQAPSTEQVAEQAAPVAEESAQDKNWRTARQRMDEQRAHIAQLEAELNQVRSHLQKPAAKQEEEPEFLTDSERKLYQHIKQLEARIESKAAGEADAVVDRLRGKYSDFDAVLHPDNIAYLKQNEPELAESLLALKSDPYRQGLAAYKMLKRTDWYQERDTMADKAKATANAAKPASVQAVRKQGALADANRFANGLTPELKKSLLKEMNEARKGA